ncbi:MAG: hypothetical protein U0528_00425 [Anaerolineae bacterium]
MRLRTIGLVAAVIVLMTAFAVPQQSAKAYADATSVSVSCSSFAVSGTTDAPYVTIYVELSGGDYYWTIVASGGGTYSGSVAYPEQPDGTYIFVQVWGSLNTYTNFEDPGYWDEDSYYEDELPCKASVPGPGAPAGWKLHWMDCSSAVFSQPGGYASWQRRGVGRSELLCQSKTRAR